MLIELSKNVIIILFIKVCFYKKRNGGNMKKILFLFVTLISLCILSSCNGYIVEGTAYDIAVKNGFEGTEEEWFRESCY